MRLFRCDECPRLHEHPKEARPSKLPMVHDFNVQIGVDVIVEKDSDGASWSWLSVLCQGTCFHVCALLPQTHKNPSSSDVLGAMASHWLSWAGYPERGIIADRAKYFLSTFAEEFDAHGCLVSAAAKASPWQIGQVERHNDLWKTTLKRVVWTQQVSGRDDMLMAIAAVNMAKNSMSRQHGFSPYQWIMGRDLRLPAALSDESEVTCSGMMALAETPGSRFFRQNQLRAAARESFAKSANDSALKRAELRKIRPTRGPFPVGTYVYYYDRADRPPGPNNWRGLARVVGHEGQSTVWLSHRGILVAASPEHLSRAYEKEFDRWMAVNNERALIDAMPAAGGSGFLDLRRAPVPEENEFHEPEGVGVGPRAEGEITDGPMAEAAAAPLENAAPSPAPTVEDMSSSSTSMARIRWESERAAQRDARASDFFKRKEVQRAEERERKRIARQQAAEVQAQPEVPVLPEDVPAGVPYDPDIDDYHTPPTRQLSPVVEVDEEPAEREAKRLRAGDKPESSAFVHDNLFAYMAVETKNFLRNQAAMQYDKHSEFYEGREVSKSDFVFAVKR